MGGPDIKKFEIEGAVRDTGHLLRKQGAEEKKLRARMSRQGYVPVLDIVPLVTTEYSQEKQTFTYVITIYGVESNGEEGEFEGWLSGRFIKSTPKDKSEQSSSLWE